MGRSYLSFAVVQLPPAFRPFFLPAAVLQPFRDDRMRGDSNLIANLIGMASTLIAMASNLAIVWGSYWVHGCCLYTEA